uniref:Glyoxalase domain-containing protein 5 n=1 Tax=Gasterosteus aculeatus aculeatus TaxID=481459 RepID=A0AAQ4PR18_GASAC
MFRSSANRAFGSMIRSSFITVSIQTLGVRSKQRCPIQVSRLNHLVFTVKSVPDTINFYSSVLGMEVVTFKVGTREALAFGQQKFEPKVRHPTPGSADLCLITSTPLATVAAHLKVVHLSPTEGPSGKDRSITSLHFIDPDHNLIEM